MKAFTYILCVICSYIYAGTALSSSIPDYYEEPGIVQNRSHLSQTKNEYIDPFSGLLKLQYTDILIPGQGGLDLKVQRTYSSRGYSAGSIFGFRGVNGIGWTLHFSRVVKPSDNICAGDVTGNILDNPILELSDGSRQILYYSKSIDSSYPLYLTASRWKAECSSSNDGLIVSSPDGVHYTMSKKHHAFAWSSNEYSWYASKITDRHGNAISIEYRDSLGYILIDKVTTTDGRSLNFGYTDEGTYNVRLTSISTSQSTWYYYYTKIEGVNGDYWQLTGVKQPEETWWRYEYYPKPVNPNSEPGYHSLRFVTTPLGGKTEYEYKYVEFDNNFYNPLNVALSVKRVSGPDTATGTWNFVYEPGTGTGAIDVTTISGPHTRYIFRHFGYLAASSGSVWKIGLLLEKEIGSPLLHHEKYEWGSQLISTENQFRRTGDATSKTDSDSHVPILTDQVTIRDGSTYTTTYSNFDAYGNARTKVEQGPNGANDSRTTTYTYQNFADANKWILGLVDIENISTVGIVDRDYYTTGTSTGNLSRLNKFGAITSYEYDAQGQISKITDPVGNISTYTNYSLGIPRTETHAVGKPEAMTLTRVVNSPTGTIASETDGLGLTTTYSYDGLNRITGIITPKTTDNDIEIKWTSLDELSSLLSRARIVTRGNFQEIRSFDGFGRTILIEAEGLKKKFTYNAEGQMLSESHPYTTANSSYGTTFQHDALSRQARITHADNSYIQYEYLAGNVTRVRNERAHLTSYTYRSFGNPQERHLVKIEAPEGVITDISRDKLGNISGAVTQGGITRTYALDTLKHLDYIDNPETGRTDVTYDAAGNLKDRKDGPSPITYYTYDGHNRLKNIDYPVGTPDTEYTYYADGSLNEIISTSSNKWKYQYDANKNLTHETFTYIPGNKNFLILNGYNGNDNLERITYPSNKSVLYSPDDLGRAQSASPYATNVDYHPNGAISQINYANSYIDTFTQHPTRLFTQNVNIPSATLTYGYDVAGNTTSIVDSQNSLNSLSSITYDQQNRVTAISGASWGNGTISYSADGDILTKNIGGTNLTYIYNPTNNQLTSITGTKPYTFGYDVYGNITSNSLDAFTYNNASQLTNVSNKNIAYKYDGNNRRAIIESAGNNKFVLYNQRGQLMHEADINADSNGNSFQNDYIYLGNKMIARDDKCTGHDNDADGLNSCEEIKLGLNPNNSDTDADGIPDGYEFNNGLNPLVNDAALDKDGDGLTNLQEYQLGTKANNPDTDADGMPDGYEVTHGLNPRLNDASADIDGDALSNIKEYQSGTNPNNPDTDGDGMPDGYEVTHGLNPLANDLALDRDNDGIPNGYEFNNGLNPSVNDAALDKDSDGLTNLQEYQLGTKANNPDTDADGMPDGYEFNNGLNPLVNDFALDKDSDGMPNGYEFNNGLNPSVNDAALDKDGDGLTNLQEYQLGTKANNPDTDADGMPDGYELNNSLNPLTNDAALDKDSDGLTNLQEYQLGTKANNPDTDADGMPDGYEVTHGLNPLANDLALDRDNDGIPNGYEFNNGLNPSVNDAALDKDSDGLTNLQEYQLGTKANNPDTDADGMPDGYEFNNGLNPLINDAALDKDGDGLTNLKEFQLGTKANNPDTDADLMPDGYEHNHGLNPLINDSSGDLDGDMITNIKELGYRTKPNQFDTDGDTLGDGFEIIIGSDPLDPNSPDNTTNPCLIDPSICM